MVGQHNRLEQIIKSKQTQKPLQSNKFGIITARVFNCHPVVYYYNEYL